MKPTTVFFASLCQFFLVAGQICFKRAMRETPAPPSEAPSPRPIAGGDELAMVDYQIPSPGNRTRSRSMKQLGLGIFLMSLWFFIWTNLLEGENLSKIFPFEGLNPVLMVFAAWLFLKERQSWDTAAGVLLICGGIFLASGS